MGGKGKLEFLKLEKPYFFQITLVLKPITSFDGVRGNHKNLYVNILIQITSRYLICKYLCNIITYRIYKIEEYFFKTIVRGSNNDQYTVYRSNERHFQI